MQRHSTLLYSVVVYLSLRRRRVELVCLHSHTHALKRFTTHARLRRLHSLKAKMVDPSDVTAGSSAPARGTDLPSNLRLPPLLGVLPGDATWLRKCWSKLVLRDLGPPSPSLLSMPPRSLIPLIDTDDLDCPLYTYREAARRVIWRSNHDDIMTSHRCCAQV